jgi:hypothetical protein
MMAPFWYPTRSVNVPPISMPTMLKRMLAVLAEAGSSAGFTILSVPLVNNRKHRAQATGITL